jgi:hydroxyacylglutathione hydrolase
MKRTRVKALKHFITFVMRARSKQPGTLTMHESFENHPYQENTYVLYDGTGKCCIIDPGMHTADEQNAVATFITENELKPVMLLNTHCHIDHVLGNKFIFDMYGLYPRFHKGEQDMLDAQIATAAAEGLHYHPSPNPKPNTYLPEKGTIHFGDTRLEILYVPGHSPAHLCFYNPDDNYLIAGDVLFNGSIGRTDMPGGNHKLLMKGLWEKVLSLPEDCIVYPGHGPRTTIATELELNPYLNT